MLLLDAIVPSEPKDDDERTLLEEAALTLLLDSFLTLEEDFAVATLLLDFSLSLRMTEEELLTEDEDFAKVTLLLDSSLSLGVTGEELLSPSQAARRSKLEIAKAKKLFDFSKATKRPFIKDSSLNL